MDVHERLTTQYKAKEVDKSNYSDLRRDLHADWGSVVTAYIFRDANAIRELEKLNAESQSSDTPIALIVNSTDKIHITGATFRGISFLLLLEFSVFVGLDDEDMFLGNERFEEYLLMLYILGYIQFDNDSTIDYIRDLYKNGYYLRYSGINDGAQRFLDRVIDITY